MSSNDDRIQHAIATFTRSPQVIRNITPDDDLARWFYNIAEDARIEGQIRHSILGRNPIVRAALMGL